LSTALFSLYNDLDLSRLRINRPSKFVFLCGGTISTTPESKASSLRDYLYRQRKIRQKLRGNIVLAETATQLYRDTTYDDLISFEEDIAKIAALVLVIAESPGSLAELGAFATNQIIAKTLRIIIQDKYASSESFIRFGPVRKIENSDRGFVGYYPWRVNGSVFLVLGSIKSHYRYITSFINRHFDAVPKAELIRNNQDSGDFYIIYWVIHILLVVPPAVLYECVSRILPGSRDRDIKNKLYCMKLAGWIDIISYSGKDYYHALHPIDPLSYSFKPGVAERDIPRRKWDINSELAKTISAPRYVRRVANERRELNK
jgi:hypothetical protein